MTLAPDKPTTTNTVQNAQASLPVTRFFTKPETDPYDEIAWEIRSAVIEGPGGAPVFEQHEIEFPKTWTQNATNVVPSKYFRGPLDTPERETSVRQMISRVVDTIAGWGRKGGYFLSEEEARTFADELTHLMLHQKACFNSPVWFTVGVDEKPQ